MNEWKLKSRLVHHCVYTRGASPVQAQSCREARIREYVFYVFFQISKKTWLFTFFWVASHVFSNTAGREGDGRAGLRGHISSPLSAFCPPASQYDYRPASTYDDVHRAIRTTDVSNVHVDRLDSVVNTTRWTTYSDVRRSTIDRPHLTVTWPVRRRRTLYQSHRWASDISLTPS